MAAIYKAIRDSSALTDAQQIAIVSNAMNYPADELQQQWQAYLMAERVTQRWEPTIRGMVADFPKNYRYPYKNAAVELQQQSLQSLQEYYKNKVKERRERSGPGTGTGPQQF